MTSGREYSDETARLMDEEISRILLEQEQRAHTLLMKHRPALDLVADALLDKETIDGQEVAALVQASLGDSNEHTSQSIG
jgi:cell division protease FtsH